MSGPARAIAAGSGHAFPFSGERPGLIVLSVLAVTAAAFIMAVTGKLDSTYVVVIAALALVAGLLGAFAPRVVLTVLFAIAPLVWALGDANIFQSDIVRVNLPMLVGFVILVGFGHLLLVKYSDPTVEIIRKLVLFMGLVCVPAILYAQDFVTGAGIYLRVMVPYIVLFAIVHQVRNRGDVHHYAKCMLMALVAVAIAILVGCWRSDLWVDLGGYTRLTLLYFPPQGSGMFLSVMVLVVVMNYLLTRSLGYLFLLAFPLSTLFFTYVRTAWVGAAVVLVLLAFHMTRKSGRRLLIAGLLLLPLVFLPAWRGILRYDTSVDSPEVADRVLSGRLVVDAIAIQTYLDAPLVNKLFGIGFLRAGDATALVYGEEFLIHDDYLGYLIEAGVFAFLAYVSILIVLLRRSRQGSRHVTSSVSSEICFAAFALIIAVMIMGIPGAFYTQVLSNLYIYGIMGLMLSQAFRAARSEKSVMTQPTAGGVQWP